MATRASRNRIAAEVVLPPDVRLLNLGAAVLAVVGGALAIAAAVFWLARQPAFAIRSIAVGGDVARNSVATIRANAAPRLAGNFLTLDLGAVRQAFENVPWVRHAVVRRVWPSRLQVQLEEHRPAALWESDAAAGDKLVNSYGEVFEANVGDVEDDAIPVLAGPEGSSAHLLAMHARLDTAFTPLGARIERLALSSRGSWEATLDSGAVVEIGRGSDDELMARAQRFVSTVPQVTGRFQRPLAHADLRHTGGYAVKLRGVTTLPASAPATAAKR